MASQIETGHAKNVAHFQTLITYCSAHGATYNPSNAVISLVALQALQQEALAALASLNALLPAYINAVNAREAAFSDLHKYITRVINAIEASDMSHELKADVKTLIRKLRGKRATPKKEPAAPQEATEKSISTSQMSFDQRIENLDKLVQLLTAQPNYVPNEPNLTVTGMAALLTNLRALNTAAVTAYTPVSNARIARNTLLYAENTGLVDRSIAVKAYIKSVFGATSPQYKQLSGLKFTRSKH